MDRMPVVGGGLVQRGVAVGAVDKPVSPSLTDELQSRMGRVWETHLSFQRGAELNSEHAEDVPQLCRREWRRGSDKALYGTQRDHRHLDLRRGTYRGERVTPRYRSRSSDLLSIYALGNKDCTWTSLWLQASKNG